MSEIADSFGIQKKEKEHWSFEKDEDGISKRVSGREVENGWVIEVHKSWTEKSTANGHEEYKSNSWTYIAKEDPLKKLRNPTKDEPKEQSEVSTFLAEVVKSDGMLMVD